MSTSERASGLSISLALRSLLWTFLFPGFFAGFVPWQFFGLREVVLDWQSPRHLAGIAITAIGVILLGTCIWEFARRGRGTLSPVDPPTHLVIQGLYRYVRNPMYLTVSTIVLGETLLTGSMGLFVFWIVWFVVVNIFVIGYEEPTLRRHFGKSYDEYQSAVGRWLPRFRSREMRGPSHG